MLNRKELNAIEPRNASSPIIKALVIGFVGLLTAASVVVIASSNNVDLLMDLVIPIGICLVVFGIIKVATSLDKE
jgi:hypothetical protein